MKKLCLFVPLVFSLLLSCNDYRPARTPPWASESNQIMITDETEPVIPEDSPSHALLNIESFTCGFTKEEAYIVDVSWITTVRNIDTVRIEYDIIIGPAESGDVMIVDPTVALEGDSTMGSGATMIKIPSNKISEAGDAVLVRLVVVSYDGTEYKSPTVSHFIEELCMN